MEPYPTTDYSPLTSGLCTVLSMGIGSKTAFDEKDSLYMFFFTQGEQQRCLFSSLQTMVMEGVSHGLEQAEENHQRKRKRSDAHGNELPVEIGTRC